MPDVKDEIAKNILYYRKKCGLTQKALADLLGVKHNAISSWENGTNSIDMDTLFQVCQIFKISISEVFGIFGKTENEVTSIEYDYIKKYRELDECGRQHVDNLLAWEAERINSTLQKDSLIDEQAQYISELEDTIRNINDTPTRMVCYYQRLASAGTGNVMWDDLLVDEIEIPNNHITKDGDFVIGVDGDSMEPLYWDTDMILVKKMEKIELGEIGVFTLDGVCLIKELGKNQLISRNPKYPPILFNETSNVKCLGKVICNLMEHSDDEIDYMIKRKEYIRNYNKVYHIAAENGLDDDEETHEYVEKIMAALKEKHETNE